MNSPTKGIQKAIVCWLSGMRLAEISALPEVTRLTERGAVVELDPSPITGPLNHHYQVLSGKEPSRFGFFDTLIPHDYRVMEESVGRGGIPTLLPDVLRNAGWTVHYAETRSTDLANCIARLTHAGAPLPSCLLVKCTGGEPSPLSTLAEALRIADAWVGEAGLLAVLSDSQPASVKRWVNVNNLLAELEVLERDNHRGQIHWPGSLAYFAGHGQLWVNLLGRDAQGAVSPHEEYEEVRDTLIKVLPAKVCDPGTGNPVIERVYRKEELYAAEYLFCAPDLVVVFQPGYAPSPRSTRIDFDEATLTTPKPGTTVLEGVHPSLLGGFLLAAAPPLAYGSVVPARLPLTAVRPTLFHALGVDSPAGDSPAISAFFTPSYLEKHPIRAGLPSQDLSAEDEELLINRLRDLGYV